MKRRREKRRSVSCCREKMKTRGAPDGQALSVSFWALSHCVSGASWNELPLVAFWCRSLSILPFPFSPTFVRRQWEKKIGRSKLENLHCLLLSKQPSDGRWFDYMINLIVFFCLFNFIFLFFGNKFFNPKLQKFSELLMWVLIEINKYQFIFTIQNKRTGNM